VLRHLFFDGNPPNGMKSWLTSLLGTCMRSAWHFPRLPWRGQVLSPPFLWSGALLWWLIIGETSTPFAAP
jgi:hypothetical protein